MLDGQRIDPVAWARMMRDRVTSSGLVGQVPSWGSQFGIRTGSPDEWTRFFTMLQQQESGHRIAPVNPDGSLRRFATTPAGERSYGPGQFNIGEYGLKTWADVNNPSKVADAYINVAQAGKVPAYFGSVQRPNETLQHGSWYDQTVAPKLGGPQAYGEDAWLDPSPQPAQSAAAPSNRLLAMGGQPQPTQQSPQGNAGLNHLADMFFAMGRRPQAPQPQFGYTPMALNLNRFARG